VDDEPAILAGLARMLRGEFDMVTAPDGTAGLETLRREGPFAAVVSDLRMPGLDGVQFLAQAEREAPDTVRVLLTGNADVASAVQAINQGRIFRLLCKPSPRDEVLGALRAAVEQHRLVTAERELLQRTLRGSVQALLETLSLANPLAFARATRIKSIVRALMDECGVDDWNIEVAAMLSQLGAVTLPREVAAKLDHGESLTATERHAVSRLPSLAEQLLSAIPRLEVVRAIIAEQEAPPGAAGISLGGRMLRIAQALDLLEATGADRMQAVARLRERHELDDPMLAEALARLALAHASSTIRDVPVTELITGMVFAADVFDAHGVLLIGRGQEIGLRLLELIRNQVDSGRVTGDVSVVVPRHADADRREVLAS